ncbi:MAG: LysM peptidoglycan-binding domain-containing protein [Chloroflexota bacterium]
MNEGRQAILGVFVALLSIAIVLGSALISMTEVGYEVASAPDLTATQEMLSMPTLVFIVPGSTLLALSATPQASLTPTASLTPRADCLPPPGWVLIEVKDGDTFKSLAKAYSTSVDEIKAANCMRGETLPPRSTLYVPNRPPITASPTPVTPTCGAPNWWVNYRVVSGDNIYSLAQRTGSTTSQLAWGNCLFFPYTIYPGQILRLPRYPAPLPSNTPKPSATLPASLTPTLWITLPLPATPTPTPTPTHTLTHTPTNPVGPTPTPTSTATQTEEPTNTTTVTLPVIAKTPTPTQTPTNTLTPVVLQPAATSTPTNTLPAPLPPTSTTTSPPYPLALSAPAPTGPSPVVQRTFTSLLSAAFIFFVVREGAKRRDS